MLLTFVIAVELQPNHRQGINLPNRGVSTRRDFNLLNRGVSIKRDVVKLSCTVGSYFSILDGCKRDVVKRNSMVTYIAFILLILSKISKGVALFQTVVTSELLQK